MLNAIAAKQGYTQVGNILAQFPVAPAQSKTVPVVDTGALSEQLGRLSRYPLATSKRSRTISRIGMIFRPTSIGTRASIRCVAGFCIAAAAS